MLREIWKSPTCVGKPWRFAAMRPDTRTEPLCMQGHAYMHTHEGPEWKSGVCQLSSHHSFWDRVSLWVRVHQLGGCLQDRVVSMHHCEWLFVQLWGSELKSLCWGAKQVLYSLMHMVNHFYNHHIVYLDLTYYYDGCYWERKRERTIPETKYKKQVGKEIASRRHIILMLKTLFCNYISLKVKPHFISIILSSSVILKVGRKKKDV